MRSASSLTSIKKGTSRNIPDVRKNQLNLLALFVTEPADSVRSRQAGQGRSQQRAAAVQARHNRADGYAQDLRNLLVRELLDIGKQHRGAEIRGDPIESGEDVHVTELFGN